MEDEQHSPAPGEGTVTIEGIGRVCLRLIPTEEELIRADRARRARGFFLALVEPLVVRPPYAHADWASLPEEELRKTALLIAAENDLLSYFRPKGEKPFYNAFRNAWRMKRASHNEAVFQRALSIWKEHLESAISAAAKAYGQAVEKERNMLAPLARAGFVLAPGALSAFAGVSRDDGLSEEVIGGRLEALWTEERLAELVDLWFDLEPFRRRERFIRDAFSAYLRGEYALAIYGLFPQPEGVMWDFLSRTNPAEPEIEELIRTQKRTFVTVEALLRKILARLIGEEDLLFYRFVKFIDFADDSSLNRHAVGHGASIAFGTKRNALRLILFLDFTHAVLEELLK
ncbi:hypothetical protein LR032_05070 [Candidatus Bipolaricaulota bacterium]|nr:hypothetical protein [Candidatus Bipolaricaulota bacterium]